MVWGITHAELRLRLPRSPAGEWEYAWVNCGGLSYRAQADSQWAFKVDTFGGLGRTSRSPGGELCCASVALEGPHTSQPRNENRSQSPSYCQRLANADQCTFLRTSSPSTQAPAACCGALLPTPPASRQLQPPGSATGRWPLPLPWWLAAANPTPSATGCCLARCTLSGAPCCTPRGMPQQLTSAVVPGGAAALTRTAAGKEGGNPIYV